MPIQLLPPQLANQIAAGEVVERPASVVKELVENSLDAGATDIDIAIEKGGSKKILLRDNGSGIAKDELALALSRHATSKIAVLADLERICSLGFRGEALASISSVSRLTLTSKPASQNSAWQACAEGREMNVKLQPAAHPDGTSIEVLDLFFNTPARRRFLRSDKTEFAHIDELVKRLALSRFDVSWQLHHNGISVRRLPAIRQPQDKQKRLAAVCGKQFAEQALWIETQYQQIALRGWILPAGACTMQSACQYSYVNGRMMRDKLLNHAIRQAYGDMLAAEQHPAFVLYLEVDPADVDVNVHPTKHEVRFQQARLVHDFVVSALTDALQQGAMPLLVTAPERQAPITAAPPTSSASVSRDKAVAYRSERLVQTPSLEEQRAQIQYLASMPATPAVVAPTQGYLLWQNRYAICQQAELFLVDLAASAVACWQHTTKPLALLLPVKIRLTPAELDWLTCQADTFAGLGFDILVRDQHAIIRGLPAWLRHTAISDWFSLLLQQGAAWPAANLAEKLLDMLLTANFLKADFLINSMPEILQPSHWQAKPLALDPLNARLSEQAHGK